MRKFFSLIWHCEIIQPDVSKISIELSNITLFTSLISILFRLMGSYTLDYMVWLLLLFLIGGQGRILYTYGNEKLRYYFFGDIFTFLSIYGTLITIIIYLFHLLSPEQLTLIILPILSIGIISVMLITISLNLVKESIISYYDMYKKICIPERKYPAEKCLECKYYKKVILDNS